MVHAQLKGADNYNTIIFANLVGCHFYSMRSHVHVINRAAGTGQAGQAKAGPLFLDSTLYGIDRPIIVLGNDRQASIFVH